MGAVSDAVMTRSIHLVISIVSAGSMVVCLFTLCEIFYFKLYKQFTYRLLLYTFISIALSSAIATALPLILYSISPADLAPSLSLASVTIKALVYLHTSSYGTTLALAVVTTKHLHYMAVDLQYCRGSCVEIWCLLCALLVPQCYAWIPYTPIYSTIVHDHNPWNATSIDFCLPWPDPILGVEVLLTKSLAVLLISAAVLWIMCKRACNRSTTDLLLNHAQALRETVPLFCLYLAIAAYSVLLSPTIILRMFLSDLKFFQLLRAVIGVLGACVGLTSGLCFFLHLLALGKQKRQRLRDGSKQQKPHAGIQREQQAAGYRSTAVYVPSQWSVYTTDGYYTGSCNTEAPIVDEDEVDRQILQH